MKFRILASLLVIAAILAAVLLRGGLEGSSTSSRPQTNDGIRINP